MYFKFLLPDGKIINLNFKSALEAISFAMENNYVFLGNGDDGDKDD